MGSDSANFGMYAIVHGATKGGDSRLDVCLSGLPEQTAAGSGDESIEKLRKRMEELEKNKQADE